MNVGVVVALAMSAVFFVLLGYFLGRMYTRDIKQPPSQPIPKCLCGHMYGTHRKGYVCQVDTFSYGVKIGTCACELYVGPDPMASGLWHPPVKDDDGKGKK